MVALVSWLIPYDLINNYLSQQTPQTLMSGIIEFNQSIKASIISQVNSETLVPIKLVLIGMSVLGLFLFFKDVVELIREQKKTRKKSRYYKTTKGYEIHLIKGKPIAYSTGLHKPRIYIAQEFVDSPGFESMVQHELQHILHKDQMWLLLISFIQRLLWWNPLVIILTGLVRENIELSCDETSSRVVGKAKYQKDLAVLLLQNEASKINNLVSPFFTTQKNLHRIKQISKEHKMNTKNKTIIFSTAIIPFILLVFVSTQSISTTNQVRVESHETIKEDVVLKENQVWVIFKTTLYSKQEDTNHIDHREIESSLIVNLNEKNTFNFGKDNKSLITFEARKKENDTVNFNFKIMYSIDDKKHNYNPSLLIKKYEKGAVKIADDNGEHSFELEVTYKK
jgi:beta-lactamase regulating signal transducer with metallopeptidase domain